MNRQAIDIGDIENRGEKSYRRLGTKYNMFFGGDGALYRNPLGIEKIITNTRTAIIIYEFLLISRNHIWLPTNGTRINTIPRPRVWTRPRPAGTNTIDNPAILGTPNTITSIRNRLLQYRTYSIILTFIITLLYATTIGLFNCLDFYCGYYTHNCTSRILENPTIESGENN